MQENAHRIASHRSQQKYRDYRSIVWIFLRNFQFFILSHYEYPFILFLHNIYDRRKKSCKDSQIFFPILHKEIPLIRIFSSMLMQLRQPIYAYIIYKIPQNYLITDNQWWETNILASRIIYRSSHEWPSNDFLPSTILGNGTIHFFQFRNHSNHSILTTTVGLQCITNLSKVPSITGCSFLYLLFFPSFLPSPTQLTHRY